MNKIQNFGNFKVQYWIEEFPQLPKVATLTSHETLEVVASNNLVHTNKICVEMYLHKNASNYGLLGFEFRYKENSNNLDIEIHFTDGNTKEYQSEINKNDKTIYCGLIEEYVSYIKNRVVDKLQKKNGLFKGSIIVSCAANSEVGSSSRIFGIISDIIIELFFKIQEKKIPDLDECFKSALYSCGLIRGEH